MKSSFKVLLLVCFGLTFNAYNFCSEAVSKKVDNTLNQAQRRSGFQQSNYNSPEPMTNTSPNENVFAQSTVSSYSSVSDGSKKKEAAYSQADTLSQKGQSYKKETDQAGMIGSGSLRDNLWEGQRKTAERSTTNSSSSPQPQIKSQNYGKTNYQEVAE